MRATRYLPLVLIAAIGCQGAPPAGSAAKDKASTAGTASGNVKATDSAQPAPKDTASKPQELPAALKSDAYEYYGLGFDKPMDLEIDQGAGAPIMTGAQTTTLVGVKDGVAEYKVTRTGQLAQLGDSDLTLETDGIYVKASSFMKVGPREIELPAGLKAGKTWTSTVESDKDGQKTKLKSVFKVVGPSKVTTKVGSYPDALLIVSTGSGTMSGTEVKVDSKMWMVKGRGAVRSELIRTPKGGSPVKMVIQETK